MSAAQWLSRLTFGLVCLTVIISPLRADDRTRYRELWLEADRLVNEGKIKEAIPIAEQALELARRTLGEAHTDTATLMSDLADFYRKTDQFARAEPLYQKSLSIREAKLGRDHQLTASTLNELAFVYQHSGRYSKAEPMFHRALAIRSVKLGRDHIQTLMTRGHLARLYHEMGQYSRAEGLYQQVLTTWETKFGRSHTQTAATLNNMAQLYLDMGLHARAQPLFEQALKVCEDRYGTDHPQTALCHIKLAKLFVSTGQLNNAEEELEKSRKISESKLGQDLADSSLALTTLAELYQEMGRYTKAEPLFRKALASDEDRYGKDHPQTATTLYHFAGLFHVMGQYGQAELLYRRALAIQEEKLGKDHPRTAKTLHDLAQTYLSLSQYSQAEPLYKRALAIQNASLGSEHPETATTINNLAAIAQARKQYTEAETLLRQALAIREGNLGTDHPETAGVLENLANLYSEMGQFARAESLYKQVLSVRESRLGKDHPSTAATLNSLASCYMAMGKIALAEPMLFRAIEVFRARLGKDHPTTAVAVATSASLYAAQDRTAEAVRTLDRSIRSLRRHASEVLPILGDREQLNFLAQSFDKTLKKGLALTGGGELSDEDQIRAASWLLNGKAIAAEALAERGIRARDADSPEARQALAELQDLRRQIAQLTLKSGKSADPKLLETMVDQERKLASSLAGFDARSRRDDPWFELDELRQRLPAKTAFIDIARFAPHDFKTGKISDERYVAFISYRAAPTRVVDLGDAASVDSAVLAVRKGLEGAEAAIKAKGEPAAEADLKTLLADLGRLVLDPITSHVAGSDSWIISPDSQLWIVPWSILPMKDGSYAVEKHVIQYTVSGRDLMLNPLRLDRKSTKPVMLADPDFDATLHAIRLLIPASLGGNNFAGKLGKTQVTFSFNVDGTMQILDAKGKSTGSGKWVRAGDRLTMETARSSFTGTISGSTASGDRVFRADGGGGSLKDPWEFQFTGLAAPRQEDEASTRGLSKDFKLGAVRRLPGTALEAESVAPKLARFAGSDPTVLMERRASASAFRSLKSPSVVVMSTHGFFLADEPGGEKEAVRENPLLRCGLLLAGCNHAGTTPPGGDTGVLTGLEVVGTDLRGTKLVVLSACETGLGEVRNGEGVAGLRQAFQLAGAECVVATLWQIPDRDSAFLMSSFFGKLAAKQQRDTALTDAQREMIANRRDRFGAAHPYFWAAYTLTGQAN